MALVKVLQILPRPALHTTYMFAEGGVVTTKARTDRRARQLVGVATAQRLVCPRPMLDGALAVCRHHAEAQPEQGRAGAALTSEPRPPVRRASRSALGQRRPATARPGDWLARCGTNPSLWSHPAGAWRSRIGPSAWTGPRRPKGGPSEHTEHKTPTRGARAAAGSCCYGPTEVHIARENVRELDEQHVNNLAESIKTPQRAIRVVRQAGVRSL